MNAENPRIEVFPELLQKQLQWHFRDLAGLLKQKPYLPSVIKGISDHFLLRKPESTPWSLDGALEGYFVYFHVLNTLRMVSTLKQLKMRLPSLEAQTAIDFGSGLGATEIAWQSVFSEKPLQWNFIEAEPQVTVWHEKLRHRDLGLSASFQWRKDLFADLDVDIFFASYALNEIDELPQQALKANTVVLLEPSDRYHSRQLMSWREALIKAGFQILAPCTHQGGCPLLEHSRADFCHDRIPVEKPSWFQKIEDELPINNNSLTFSYLIASKQQPCALKENTARIIGDTLKEKGKTKQMICRSDQREFLSWLKRHGQAPFLPHGSLVELPEGIEVKGSELRVGGQQIKALS